LTLVDELNTVTTVYMDCSFMISINIH